jgi:acetyl esterase/lipase
MLQIFGVFYASILILGGILRFFPIFPAIRSFWYLQLAVSELGLALAVPLAVPLIVMTAAYFKKDGPVFTGLTAVLYFLAPIAIILAVLPVLETIAQERNWIWDLQYGYGRDEKPDTRISSPYVGDLSRPLFRFMDFFHFPTHPFALKEEFVTADGAKLPIYIFRSQIGKEATLHPWVFSIHGGGWSNGDPRDLDQTVPFLTEYGYTVIASRYRFAPTYSWPRQQEDLETAYDYVIKNAQRLGIDPKQMWILGRSAGGQIALKLAYDSKVVRDVKGVIALYTPTDLDFGYRWAQTEDILGSRDMLKDLIGTTPDLDAAKYRAASPLADVRPGLPPTLLMHGRADPLAWYRHSDRLSDALRAAKVHVVHLELPWATHGFDYFPNSPGGQIARNAILRFMENP